MVLRSLWSYLLGYVIIKVKGGKVEELLNRAARNGISLWDCRQIAPGFYVASLRIRSFRRLRHLVRQLGLDIRIVRRVGLPFLIQRALGRPGFLLGVAAFAVLVYLLSGFIWFVDVQGYESLDPQHVLQQATEAGLKPGVRKDTLILTDIEHHLMSTIPGLAWVGVTLEGTRASVEVVEKVIVNKDESAPGDVVASKSGLIEQIIPMVGIPLVREGDTVMAGQVLISGRPHYFDETGAARFAAEGLYQRAEGIVKARVWYEAKVDVPLTQVEEVPTGQKFRAFRITIGDRQVRLGRKPPQQGVWIEQEKEIPIVWGQTQFPVQVTEIEYFEVERREYTLDRDEAAEVGIAEAEAALKQQVPEGVPLKFLPVEIEDMDSSEGQRLQVLLVGETVENIAQITKIPQEP